MPTTSFIQMCMHHFGHRNQDDNYLNQDDDVEGEEEVSVAEAGTRERRNEPSDAEPAALTGTEEDSDSGEHSLEWEMGIRRSKLANGKDVDDITLSDIVLDPDGTITYYWLGIITISVIYNIIVVILRLAFKEMRDPVIQDSVFYVLDTICDLAYLIDIIVQHAVSFYDDGCLVLDQSKTKERYQSSRKFKIDVLAILPYGSVFCFLSGIGGFFDPTGGFRILLVRFPRLLKYPTMAKFFDLTDSRTRNPNLIRAFKLTMNLWVVIHWIGCIYYVLSEYEGLGSNSWVYPSGEEYDLFSRKYIRVTYWSLMTLTTIGERPPPETDLEYVFTGLTFLIGVFVFAAVVGNVGDVISNMNAARTEFQSRMDQLKSYLQHRTVEDKLQNTVIKWAYYTWKRSSVDEPSLLQLLPERLRTEIAINVHLDTLKEVEMFKKCEEGLLRELVLKLRPQVYSPGDFICRIGEIGREMFIVNHGKVEILLPKGPKNKPSVITTLTRGKYFGEISLLKMDEGQNSFSDFELYTRLPMQSGRRTADVKAVGYCELLRLSRRDLMSALIEYPNAKRILEDIARERFASTKKEFEECTRRISTAEDPSNNLSDNQRPKKLLRIIQSKSFQDMLTARTKEQNEIHNILQELKKFDSQSTKDKVESLQVEVTNLRAELTQKNQEIASLKRKVKGHRKPNRSIQPNGLSAVSSTNRQNSQESKDSDHTSGEDSNGSPDKSFMRKKNLSVDSAYTSTDLPAECCSHGQNADVVTVINDKNTKSEVCKTMGIVSPKITIDSHSDCEIVGGTGIKPGPCCHGNHQSAMTLQSETLIHKSNCSHAISKHHECQSFKHSGPPSSMNEANSTNAISAQNSRHHSTVRFEESTNGGNKNFTESNEAVMDTNTRVYSDVLTRKQSEQELVCELLLGDEMGLSCDRDHLSVDHVNTMHKIHALNQLLTVEDGYLTDQSFRSAENSSDEASDYDL